MKYLKFPYGGDSENASVKDTEDLTPVVYPKILRPSKKIVQKVSMAHILNKVKKINLFKSKTK